MSVFADRLSADGFSPLHALMALCAAAVAWNDTRTTRKTLRDLEDHRLYDIGLRRGEIETLRF